MKVSENLCLLFYLETKESSKTGQTPIYVRLTVNGQRKELSTGMKIDPKFWDSSTWRVIGKTPGVLAMNNNLTQIRANLEKHYLVLTTQYEYVTADLLKKAYKGELNRSVVKKERTLCQAYNHKYSIFASQVKKKLRAATTLRKWKTTKRKIRQFLQSKYKKWDLPLSAFTHEDAIDFMNYLTLQDDLEPNTAWKYIKNTKELFEIAAMRKWIPENPWSKYMIGNDQKDREILSMQDIIDLYNHDLIGRLDYVRDISLFAIFTGYAFCELDSFTKDDIFLGDDGKRWIKIDRRKTGKAEIMPLLPIPAAIVDKYKNDPYCVKHNKLLPLRSYQHFNGYLKELGNICKLSVPEPTPHELRHTFATTICLDNDVPMETVMRLLGHTNIRTTQIYAKVSRKKISRNMSELEAKLFGYDGKLIPENAPIVRIPGFEQQKTAS